MKLFYTTTKITLLRKETDESLQNLCLFRIHAALFQDSIHQWLEFGSISGQRHDLQTRRCSYGVFSAECVLEQLGHGPRSGVSS